MNNTSITLEELSKLGERFYNEKLRTSLEKKYMGEYVVIDVEKKEYEVDADRLAALDKAQAKFGQKLFYILQIGSNINPEVNFISEKDYAWNI